MSSPQMAEYIRQAWNIKGDFKGEALGIKDTGLDIFIAYFRNLRVIKY
jgi:hypothetical protein